jgi:hypothetical protein
MIAHAVTSERLQRQVERLLDEADRAFTASDWAGLRTSANGVLTLDSENGTARAYLVAATKAFRSLRRFSLRRRPTTPTRDSRISATASSLWR